MRELSLGNLKHIAGGTVDAAFQHHLKRAIADCEDRPGDKTARAVVLTINVTPVMLQDGAATDVRTECVVKSTVPPHISKPTECRVKHGGRAAFNDLSENNVDQMTIDEVSGDDD